MFIITVFKTNEKGRQIISIYEYEKKEIKDMMKEWKMTSFEALNKLKNDLVEVHQKEGAQYAYVAIKPDDRAKRNIENEETLYEK